MWVKGIAYCGNMKVHVHTMGGIFFDLGTGKNDVTKYMDPDKDIHIILF